MAFAPTAHLPKKVLAGGRRHDRAVIAVSPLVIEGSALAADLAYGLLASRAEGLTSEEAEARLRADGPNVLAIDKRASFGRRLSRALLDPLVILLAVLAAISTFTGDPQGALLMALMVALSVSLKIIQETKAGNAAAKLEAMITVNATVVRDGQAREVPVASLVRGDVVHLAAGDMIPGDLRLVQSKDLFVVQGSFTGESIPVEKFSGAVHGHDLPPFERSNIAFLGMSVGSGSATGLVLATGKGTYLGGMADALAEPSEPTAFDRGIRRFTWLMLRFMAVMVPLVFFANGLTKGHWSQAFLFALAVAVGLTPTMLPMIVTVCLSKGAISLGKKKVIVKRIGAIQDLGGIDVLCTDKTGTLTMNRVTLERYCDVALVENEHVLALAYTNSHFQTGLASVLDRAVLAHEEARAGARIPELAKVDEVPFDFVRRIMSVIVRTADGQDLMIAKGAPEAIFARCITFRLADERLAMDHAHIIALKREYERLSADGFRVLAIATKATAARGTAAYGKNDECELVLEGYVAFLDPPKESAREAIERLTAHGVSVKVVTGDNMLVAAKICKEVGLRTDDVLVGDAVEAMSDAELAGIVERTTLFARVSPAHKERIIRALQSRKHVVGFLGDGINDAPALHVADVGISVDSAVDIAKASADMILLEQSLLVLDDAVVEGRKVFSNIVKYVRMGASSSFGNMFSVVFASVFVPFLPMLPLQILVTNMLYDLSQTAIPTDAVDAERTLAPRTWDMKELARFILLVGPCSSVFDVATFLVMLHVFGCDDVSTQAAAMHGQALFHTGWFVESVVTQTLIIHVIRTNKIPFLQSWPSRALLVTSGAVVLVALALPFTAVGHYLGFVALPLGYWPFLAAALFGYVALTQVVKRMLVKRDWI